MDENKLVPLCEGGIPYFRAKTSAIGEIEAPKGCRRFDYTAHAPNGESFPRYVFCYNEPDIRRLLEHWSRSGWIYTISGKPDPEAVG